MEGVKKLGKNVLRNGDQRKFSFFSFEKTMATLKKEIGLQIVNYVFKL